MFRPRRPATSTEKNEEHKPITREQLAEYKRLLRYVRPYLGRMILAVIALIIGTLLGLTVGLLPGLGGIVGMTILLPVIYGMDPHNAFALLIGMVAVIPTSDTFPSVMMGIPGSSASQATIMDGYPLAKKGEAARALGAAFSASLIGGLFGALVLTVIIPIAAKKSTMVSAEPCWPGSAGYPVLGTDFMVPH